MSNLAIERLRLRHPKQFGSVSIFNDTFTTSQVKYLLHSKYEPKSFIIPKMGNLSFYFEASESNKSVNHFLRIRKPAKERFQHPLDHVAGKEVVR